MKSWHETIPLPQRVRDVTAPGLEVRPAAVNGAWTAGYEQGRVDGERALSAQLMAQRSELHEVVQGTLASLRQAVPQVIRDTENMLVTLALEVARKLVCDMPVSAGMVEAAVREALSHVEESSHVTVRLNPADLEILRKGGSTLLVPVEEGKTDFRFLSGEDVTRGGCLIETRFGTLDARRETKFDLLKEALPG